MPAEERAVCDRLLKFRKSTGLSRADFSRMVGMDARLLASYEMAHSQLNYPAAFQILTRFPISPEWLAGKGQIMKVLEPVTYPSPNEIEFGPRAPFSLVFSVVLKPLIMRARVAWLPDLKAPFPQFRFTPDVQGRLRAEEVFRQWLRRWLAALPDEKANEFLDELKRQVEGLLEDKFSESLLSVQNVLHRIEEVDRLHLKQQAAFLSVGVDAKAKKPSADQNERLTDTATSVNVTGVKDQWPALKRKLQAATAKPGLKSKLAEFLHVDLTRVSQWLTNAKSAREPGAEYALRMLYWAEHPELQK